jgi:hypothetical protein
VLLPALQAGRVRALIELVWSAPSGHSGHLALQHGSLLADTVEKVEN